MSSSVVIDKPPSLSAQATFLGSSATSLAKTARCSAKLGLEATREVGVRGESSGFSHLANWNTIAEIHQGLFQPVASQVLFGTKARQSLYSALQLALTDTHPSGHLADVQCRTRITLIEYTIQVIDEISAMLHQAPLHGPAP
jgi:hypothetical protein